jgi:uncharacterized RDD family membrane protein YckC
MAFCHHCGAALASGDELFCARCGTPVRPATGGGALAYQGVGIRFVAQLIDAVPSLVFYLAAGRLVAGVVGGVTESGFELKGGPAFLVIGLTTAFWILYMSILEGGWNGQSLGKKVAGIRVVREDGSAIDWPAALLRNVLRLADAFACYLVAAVLVWRSPRKQRLGDRIAGTVVIRTAT